ncbi:RNA 2',3'-cyclic phosphodiesterase [Lacimicrobium sp. SS2-24]|uniref:RNA 2',3'-cyclic phosphodiesterase n=1 Tax=Lacimicrobium sp. SS2-24 TaxID=2005569 RepID=UPI000B4C1DCE|nr:RNA 2',3'-cyclic phosphodiesterase [Lacimicrobium sp. SS2-24]
MRLFFGLELSPTEKLAVEKWRDINLPPLHGPVPAANFHITLAFLGQVSLQQQERLFDGADSLACETFDLTVDQMGYWPKPKTLWIGASATPPALTQLARSLRGLAGNLGLPVENRPYVPHISLYRKQPTNPPVCLTPPHFPLAFTHFSLFESVSGRGGVHYPVLARWPLRGPGNVRDNLAQGRFL